MGSGVWGFWVLGFGVWGLGFLGFVFWVLGSGVLGFGVSGSGVWVLGFRVLGSGVLCFIETLLAGACPPPMSDLPKAESPAGGPRERMHVPFTAVAPVCRRRRRVPGGPNFHRDIVSGGLSPANERPAHWRKAPQGGRGSGCTCPLQQSLLYRDICKFKKF